VANTLVSKNSSTCTIVGSIPTTSDRMRRGVPERARGVPRYAPMLTNPEPKQSPALSQAAMRSS
jgi:hypothetical protein